jgi:hypothetical protein
MIADASPWGGQRKAHVIIKHGLIIMIIIIIYAYFISCSIHNLIMNSGNQFIQNRPNKIGIFLEKKISLTNSNLMHIFR